MKPGIWQLRVNTIMRSRDCQAQRHIDKTAVCLPMLTAINSADWQWARRADDVAARLLTQQGVKSTALALAVTSVHVLLHDVKVNLANCTHAIAMTFGVYTVWVSCVADYSPCDGELRSQVQRNSLIQRH